VFERDVKINMIFWVATIGGGILVGFFAPSAARNEVSFAWGAVIMYLLGFAAFASAKISRFKKGTLISIGTKGMVPWQVWAYRGGYALMGAGFLTTLALSVGSSLKM
jgi:hypothetical protein